MAKLIVIIVIVCAAIAAYVYFTEGGPSAIDLPAATPIDPPAGAVVMPDEIRAADVLRPLMGMRDPDAIETAKAGVVGMWSPMRGWNGAVKRIEIRSASTWFSVEVFDSTIIGNQFYIGVEVPGGLPHLKPGVPVIVRGRIKNIVPTPDPVLIPARIELDQGTVLSPLP